jgi:hypothetical protein
MLRHFARVLTVAIAVTHSLSLKAEAPDGPGESRKRQPKPPLINDPDEFVLPQPMRDASAAEPGPAPRVSDTNKPFDVIPVAPREGVAPAQGRVAVGFFNHSDRDIVLLIDQRTVKLGSRYYVQIKAPREFTWRERDGGLQKTIVPADAESVEIVFRR